MALSANMNWYIRKDGPPVASDNPPGAFTPDCIGNVVTGDELIDAGVLPESFRDLLRKGKRGGYYKIMEVVDGTVRVERLDQKEGLSL